MRLQPRIERAAHVPRPRAVEVDDGDRFVPRGKLLRQRPVRVEHERRAIEHQLVLPADAIDVHDGQARLAGARDGLLAAQRLLARVVRRAIGDQQHLRAGHLRARGGRGKPDVFADDEAEAQAVDVEHARRIARREVALFIENRVVGQALLAIDLRDAAVADDRHRVVALAVVPLREIPPAARPR